MIIIGNLAVVIGVFTSGLLTALIVAIYIHFNMRRLDRKYAEKNVQLYNQMVSVDKLTQRLNKALEQQRELEVRGLVLGDLITRVRPIVETLDAPAQHSDILEPIT